MEPHRHQRLPLLAAVGAILFLPRFAWANPVGPVVQSGSASTAATGSHLQVQASPNAVIQWQSFNIAPGETTTFVQPSPQSVVWNRILDPIPSQVFGHLEANGVVVLVNSAGFYFGPDSMVTAAGLVVSTAPVTPVEGAAGLFWQFNGAPPEARIVNYGRLSVGEGGSAFLIAQHIENHGSIEAPGGSIGLVAGKEVLISERPDGRGLSATVRLPEGSIDQSGQLIANAGTIALGARVVNQAGLVQANSVREHNGVIELVASDIVLGNSGPGTAPGGQAGGNLPPATLSLDVNSAFTGFSSIHLQATRNITLSSGVTWDLAASTGTSEPGGQLLLEAGNNITLANGSSILAGQNWSVSLQAGRDFTTDNQVRPGTGSINLNGTATLQGRDGPVSLLAGNNISVASGAVRTIEGGSIEARAVAGSINTGTRNVGYRFLPTGYSVDPDLGGISTLDGGSVRLSAGLDVTSYLPLPGGTQADAGSGAFGSRPGDVSIQAGRDVSGHFVLGNGTGTIEAGRDAGTASRLLALSLISGGWKVTAAHDVLLQEIRNPNGVFNNVGFGNSPTRHLFDYSPLSYTELEAGHSVELRGTALPRYADTFEQGLTPIYPGRLEISAGAGGVTLGNDVTLFPSSTGNLAITTRDGGGLSGNKPGDLTQLVLSDSDKTRYRELGDFGISDHAHVPRHLLDPEPVRLAIAGDVSGILLGLPKRAEIQVGGDFVNSRFEAQNLAATDVTRLEVAGDIRNRNEFTSVDSPEALDISLFDLAYPPLSGALAGLPNQLAYDTRSRLVTFQGRMTGEQLQLIEHLPVRVFDANGTPLLQPNGEPLTRDVAVLPNEVAQRLYRESQDVPLNPDTGYRIGGPGRLDLSARNLDLGATVGIVSQGPRANPALAALSTRGADVNVTLRGDLDMFSTQIASLNGGSISVHPDGHVQVGSKSFSASDNMVRGIYTVDPSDVSVVARGDIEVNGSRIAAYDGGDVTVRSLEGSIDAGSGGSGAATVEKIVVDEATRRVLSYAPTIPGSGILATTFPPSLDPAFPRSTHAVGDILVETPRGDIRTSAGGVVQIPLNGRNTSQGTVTLRAGSKDAEGQVTYRGDIDASGSGVIGSTVRLDASGDVKGLVFARESIDVTARQNVNVTALAQGNVSVSSGGNISGTLIGVGSVSAASAGNVDAALLSQNVSTSGGSSSAQVGFSQGTAANATSQAASKEEPTQAAAKSSRDTEPDPDEKRRKAVPPKLRTVGRVTVILPTDRP